MGVTLSNTAGNVTRLLSLPGQLQNQAGSQLLQVQGLANEHKEEVLAFLARRPIHTVCMSNLKRLVLDRSTRQLWSSNSKF